MALPLAQRCTLFAADLHKWKADGSSEPVTVADVLELYRRAKGGLLEVLVWQCCRCRCRC